MESIEKLAFEKLISECDSDQSDIVFNLLSDPYNRESSTTLILNIFSLCSTKKSTKIKQKNVKNFISTFLQNIDQNIDKDSFINTVLSLQLQNKAILSLSRFSAFSATVGCSMISAYFATRGTASDTYQYFFTQPSAQPNEQNIHNCENNKSLLCPANELSAQEEEQSAHEKAEKLIEKIEKQSLKLEKKVLKAKEAADSPGLHQRFTDLKKFMNPKNLIQEASILRDELIDILSLLTIEGGMSFSDILFNKDTEKQDYQGILKTDALPINPSPLSFMPKMIGLLDAIERNINHQRKNDDRSEEQKKLIGNALEKFKELRTKIHASSPEEQKMIFAGLMNEKDLSIICSRLPLSSQALIAAGKCMQNSTTDIVTSGITGYTVGGVQGMLAGTAFASINVASDNAIYDEGSMTEVYISRLAGDGLAGIPGSTIATGITLGEKNFPGTTKKIKSFVSSMMKKPLELSDTYLGLDREAILILTTFFAYQWLLNPGLLTYVPGCSQFISEHALIGAALMSAVQALDYSKPAQEWVRKNLKKYVSLETIQKSNFIYNQLAPLSGFIMTAAGWTIVPLFTTPLSIASGLGNAALMHPYISGGVTTVLSGAAYYYPHVAQSYREKIQKGWDLSAWGLKKIYWDMPVAALNWTKEAYYLNDPSYNPYATEPDLEQQTIMLGAYNKYKSLVRSTVDTVKSLSTQYLDNKYPSE